MGEGWGDYVACTINDTTVVGAWVVDRPGRHPAVSATTSNFPDTFGDLGTRPVHARCTTSARSGARR